MNLPATAVYKIRVDFGKSIWNGASASLDGSPTPEGVLDARGVAASASAGARPGASPANRAAADNCAFDGDDPFDVAIVRWAQRDITGIDGGGGIDPEPFVTAARWIAGEMGCSEIDENRLLERLRQLHAIGVIRRFGALVAHRRIGCAFNGMTVWDIVPERIDRMGAAFASVPFVSHCYARPRNDEWPYNL